MYKALFLLILAVAPCLNAYGGDLDSIISEIFGKEPNENVAAQPPVNVKESSAIKQPINPNPTTGMSCKRRDGSIGECVQYYLCNVTDTIEDGVGLIDLHVDDSPCDSYLDTCCRIEDKLPETNPVKPFTKSK